MSLSAVKLAKSLVLTTNNILKQTTLNNYRHLYTRTALGLSGYDMARLNHKKQFTNLEESFRNRMSGFVAKPDSVIFSEDLKAMLYIVEKKPEDLNLMMSMIKKYNEQKKQLRFSNFTFGPVVMRVFHYLDEPDMALNAYKDPELSEFFNQLTSIQILMDLLWNHGRYQDCLDVYDIYMKKNADTVMFPKNASVIAAACYYKLNTKESLHNALEMIYKADEKSVTIPRRGLLLIAALALKQNSPDIANELLSKIRQSNYITLRCIKVEAYVQLKRFEDILMAFRKATAMENPTGQKLQFYSDTFQRVEEAVKNEGFPEDSEIVQVLKYMKDMGHVQNLTLEEHLLSDVGEARDSNTGMQFRRNQRQDFRFNDIVNNNTQFRQARN